MPDLMDPPRAFRILHFDGPAVWLFVHLSIFLTCRVALLEECGCFFGSHFWLSTYQLCLLAAAVPCWVLFLSLTAVAFVLRMTQSQTQLSSVYRCSLVVVAAAARHDLQLGAWIRNVDNGLNNENTQAFRELAIVATVGQRLERSGGPHPAKRMTSHSAFALQSVRVVLTATSLKSHSCQAVWCGACLYFHFIAWASNSWFRE